MSMVWYCSVFFKFTLLGVKDCDATDGWNWMELVVPGTNSLFVVFLVPNKKNTPTFSPTIGSGLPFYTLLLGYAAATFITEVGGDLGFFWGCKLQWVWAYAM